MAFEDTYAYQQHVRITKKTNEILKELPDFVSDYMYSKAATEKFQPKTRLGYLEDQLLFFKYLCTSHEEFMSYKPAEITVSMLDKLTTEDIEAYLAYCEMYKGENGINQNGAPGKARKLSAIRSLFSYLVSRNKLATDVAQFVDTPSKKKDDIIYMSTEQQYRFLHDVHAGKHMNTKDTPSTYEEDHGILLRDIAIISLFLGTGIRISELVGIDLADIDFDDQSILVIRKGGKKQRVYFSDDVEDALIAYLDHSRNKLLKGQEHIALFISQRKGRLAVRSVQAMLKKYTNYTFGKDDNWKITPHKLRSTYATNLIEETNGDVYLAANAMGHSGLATIQRYAEVLKKERAAIGLRGNKSIKENQNN